MQEESSETSGPQASEALREGSVLLVDDNEEDRFLFRRFLERSSHPPKRIIEASTGKEGLMHCGATRVTCILLDLNLPDMSGIDFIKKVNRIRGLYLCPMVMLTGEGNEQLAVKAIQAGAHDYLVKGGLKSDDLIRAMMNAIDKGLLHRELARRQRDLEAKNQQLELIRNNLETLVEERTQEIMLTNDRLRVEIDQRSRAEKILRDNADFTEMIMDAVPVFIAYIDRNGICRFANREYHRVHARNEQVIRANIRDLWNSIDNDLIHEHIKIALSGSRTEFEARLSFPGDGERTYNIIYTPHVDGQDVLGFFSIGIDITERKAAETQLRDQAQLIEQSLNAVIFLDEKGNIRSWNQGARRIFRYDENEIIGKNFGCLLREAPPDFFSTRVAEPLRRSHPLEMELGVLSKDNRNREVHALFYHSQRELENSPGIVAFLIDITKRKRAERSLHQSEAKFRAIYRESAVGIALSDLEGLIFDCNPAFESMIGAAPGSLSGNNWRSLSLDNPDERRLEETLLRESLEGHRSSFRMDKRLRHHSGNLMWTRMTASIVGGRDGPANFIVRMLEDVTGQKENEAVIRRSLEEKQVLLREIHHRVKNNLQVIHSLLNMQGKESENEVVRRTLRDSQSRVRSIALIHEQLYNSDNFSHIDFAKYLGQLLKQLSRTFSLESRQVRTRICFRQFTLNINQAIPCGLIINELLTNSLKYGFVDRKEGLVEIDLKRQENNAVLSVRDDGRGFPEDFENRESKSFGLRIIQALSRQINGEVKLFNQDGAHAEITFPLPQNGTPSLPVKSHQDEQPSS